MLSNATPWMYEHAFYNGVVTQSLRANHGDSPGLKRTMVTGTSRRIFTWSGWVKRTGIQTQTESFMQVNPNNNDTGASQLGFRDVDDSDGPNIQFSHYNGSSYDFRIETSAKLRDVSSWYHIVVSVDTTQGTASNRIKIYINGVEQTSLAQNTYPSQNFDTNYNVANTVHYIAGGAAADQGGGNVYFDSYIADINYVDGLSLDATYFGETKNGVWIPKPPNVSDYGNNGARLQFKNTGTSTTSEGTTATTNIGDDSSGNGHNFAVLNYVSTDVLIDCPENNFATLDSLSSGSGVFSESNLKYVSTTDVGNGTFGITSGKAYLEVYVSSASNNYIGVLDIGKGLSPTRGGDFSSHGAIAYKQDGNQYSLPAGGSSATASYGASYTTGDIIGIAFDVDGDTVTFYKNGSSQGSTTNGLSHISSNGVYSFFVYGDNSTYIINTGQDSSFAGTKTAQGNTDGNGIGDFYYTPPSGFLALCSANLPEPTIGGISSKLSTDYFNTVLYTGNATDDRVVTTGLQTDWVWGKNRGNTDYHRLYDSSRGALKHLASNAADSESNGGDGGVKSFTSTGFTLDNTGYLNDNSGSYVSWNWKANGGTTSSNTDGAGTSTVQANTTAGFSIVTYTGSSNETYGHGLDSAPEMILVKGRNVGHNWAVYHQGVQDGTANGFLELNTTSAIQTGSNPRFLNGTTSTSQPTSTVFNVNHYSGSSTNATNNSDTYVAYCFHSVEGYSKIGSYTGNGNVDGTFIYTGFKPAWVMLKITNSADNWFIHDNKRDTFNTNAHLIYADISNAEYDASSDADNAPHDFISNGFKFRSSNANWNGNGNNYIYMAFAEAPFKYANAR